MSYLLRVCAEVVDGLLNGGGGPCAVLGIEGSEGGVRGIGVVVLIINIEVMTGTFYVICEVRLK